MKGDGLNVSSTRRGSEGYLACLDVYMHALFLLCLLVIYHSSFVFRFGPHFNRLVMVGNNMSR